MSGIFGKTPKMPKPKTPPVPARTDEEVQAAADEERKRQFAAGKASSWLTGGLGVPKSATSSAGVKLLSGSS